jgi:hypothetical protein
MASSTHSSKGKHWKPAEVDQLLSSCDKILPRGQNEWNQVYLDYNRNRPLQSDGSLFVERDEESLRNKFKTLRSSTKPTGDPNIPEPVLRAKRIQTAIERKIAVSNMDDGIDKDDLDDFYNNEYVDTQSNVGEPLVSTNVDFLPDNYSPIPGILQSSEKYTTTLRTGLTEKQLIAMNSQSSLSSTSQSLSTIKKQRIDKQIEDVVSTSSSMSSFIELYLIRSEKAEERREQERREQERKDAEERRKAEERREEERREDRQQQREHQQMMATLLAAALTNLKPSDNK